MKIRISICPIVEKEHKKEKRNYCHVYHRRWEICTCNDFFLLPFNHQAALISHEIGHLLVGQNDSEEVANKRVEEIFGVKIWYLKKTPYGKNLQWVNNEDAKKLDKYLSIFIEA